MYTFVSICVMCVYFALYFTCILVCILILFTSTYACLLPIRIIITLRCLFIVIHTSTYSRTYTECCVYTCSFNVFTYTYMRASTSTFALFSFVHLNFDLYLCLFLKRKTWLLIRRRAGLRWCSLARAILLIRGVYFYSYVCVDLYVYV